MLLFNWIHSIPGKIFIFTVIFIQPVIRLSNRINWRFGRAYRCSHLDTGHFLPALTPGMIILSHKDYEFTNFFISGYWTHSAIVTEDIHVIEAVGKGVIRTRLKDFISTVDDFIVLRPVSYETQDMRKAGEHVIKYLGYPYNFYFVPSKKYVYCSELIFRAYIETSSPDENIRFKSDSYHKFSKGKLFMPNQFSESEDFVRVPINR